MTTMGPGDPVTDLAAMANSLHELFQEYINAGFRRSEALQLILESVRAGANSGTVPDGDQ